MAREDSFPEEGGRGGGITSITFMSAVYSFDLTPSSFIYDDGRWITTWRVKILFAAARGDGRKGPSGKRRVSPVALSG